MTTLVKQYQQYRSWIRAIVGAPRHAPVVLVPGLQPPKYIGQAWHYETSGGVWIRHPAAYEKSGWSNMRYCASTLKVTVGREWLEMRRIPTDIHKTAQ